MRLIADNYPPWRLLYEMYPSVTKVWSVVARSVGDAYRDALWAFPRCLPKETWQAAVRQKAAQTKSRRWMRPWGLSGFLPPTLSPSLRLPFPNMANECLPSRTPLAFVPRGQGIFFCFSQIPEIGSPALISIQRRLSSADCSILTKVLLQVATNLIIFY
jgi:hypothetical protein